MRTKNVSTGIRTIAAAATVIALSIAGPAHAATVLVDFGSGGNLTTVDAVGRTWSNVPDSTDLAGSPHTLTATTGADSGYRLAVSNPAGVTSPVGFSGANTNGTTAPSGTAAARNYPSSATADSLYGSTVAFSGNTTQAVRLTLSNLNPDELYDLDFYASRTGVSDNRETEYLVVGANTATAFLNASNNTGTIAGVVDVRPDANNQIVIDIDPGPNNTNSTGFYYLGVLEINASPVPEPTALATLGVAGLALLRRRRRRARA